jgi:Na+(H+)/acetate symporter ActP
MWTKRFIAFMLAGAGIMVGYLFGSSENFSPFAAAISLIYTAYLGGQSATDWNEMNVLRKLK